jgi:uncharacterized membrane protein
MATPRPSPSTVAQKVVRNVAALAQLQAEAEGRVGPHQRLVERLTGSIASPWMVLTIVGSVVAWIGLNTLGVRAGLPRLDPPPFQWLQGSVSLAALLVTLMVLATQRRHAQRSARRGDLELQVNLLAEQKTAKLIALLEELRRDLPSVRDRVDPVANAMTEAVDPRAVLSVIDGDVSPRESPPGKGQR